MEVIYDFLSASVLIKLSVSEITFATDSSVCSGLSGRLQNEEPCC